MIELRHDRTKANLNTDLGGTCLVTLFAGAFVFVLLYLFGKATNL